MELNPDEVNIIQRLQISGGSASLKGLARESYVSKEEILRIIDRLLTEEILILDGDILSLS